MVIPSPQDDGTTRRALCSLTMAKPRFSGGDGSRERNDSFSLSGAKDYGQDHKSCTAKVGAMTTTTLIRPSSFPLSLSTPGKGMVLKPLEFEAEGNGG